MEIEMSIKGLMLDPITNTPIVLLHDSEGQRVLPIWVGPLEANASVLQIENISSPRPMTHDLLRNVIQGLNGNVKKVVVSAFKENTFYATIPLLAGDKAIIVDARPSDAIALALRPCAPIFAEDSVISAAKANDSVPGKGDSERLQKWLEGLDPDDLGKYKM